LYFRIRWASIFAVWLVGDVSLSERKMTHAWLVGARSASQDICGYPLLSEWQRGNLAMAMWQWVLGDAPLKPRFRFKANIFIRTNPATPGAEQSEAKVLEVHLLNKFDKQEAPLGTNKTTLG